LHWRTYIPIKGRHIIEIRNIWLPKSQRANDQFLMTAFRKMKATRAELIILNNWRIYYKVILLSEICFTSGKGIQLCFLEYNHSPITRQSSSNVNWPMQGNQDERSSKVWKRFIKQCFINPDNHQLPPLGPWNTTEVNMTTPRLGYY
jgi:hypothetical protein